MVSPFLIQLKGKGITLKRSRLENNISPPQGESILPTKDRLIWVFGYQTGKLRKALLLLTKYQYIELQLQGTGYDCASCPLAVGTRQD